MEFRPLATAIQIAVFLLAPPLFVGLIGKTKAFMAGRRGPPVLQLYRDLLKLYRKGLVISHSSSWILRTAPVVIFAAILFAGLFLPLGTETPLHFSGDIIVFAYLLAVARFWTILAAMDVGSSFEGMGASREAAFGALSELSLFLGLVLLATLTRSISFSEIFWWKGHHPHLAPALVVLFAAFFLLLLAENCRMPIDDPNTHLELTMIHEVMVLDYSGPDLALILHGAAIKLFLFMVLTLSILWPPSEGSAGLNFVWLFLKLTSLSIAIGVIESSLARLRLVKIPQLLVTNFVVTALALLVVLFGKGS